MVPDVGGGFGVKSRTIGEELTLGWLSRQVGKPVRYTETRTESMQALPQGRGQRMDLKIGGSRDGRITAYQVDVLQDAGAYPLMGAYLPMMTQRMVPGVYDIASCGFRGVSVATNKISVTAYRGAGRPEAALAIERAIDYFAAEIGMDPAEVRRRNFIPKFMEPYTTGIGTVYDVGDYGEALRRVLDAADYPALRAAQAEQRAAGSTVLTGIGLATYVEITSAAAPTEYGAVHLLADGRMRVLTGATPYGQGHVTTWKMIIADRLGVPMDARRCRARRYRRGAVRWLDGRIEVGAGRRVVARGRRRQAPRRGARARREPVGSGGRTTSCSTPTRAPFTSPGRRCPPSGGPTSPGPTASPWSGSATSRRRSRRSRSAPTSRSSMSTPRPARWSCDGSSPSTTREPLLNPLIVDGQIHGGIGQGVAQALMEWMQYDDDGNPVTSNFADYPVISAAELPSYELVHMETPTWVNPLGAKGAGESGTIGSIPAVLNAVIDALAPFGVRHLDGPATPQRVWHAMELARQ